MIRCKISAAVMSISQYCLQVGIADGAGLHVTGIFLKKEQVEFKKNSIFDLSVCRRKYRSV